MKANINQKTLDVMREHGFIAQKVERYNTFSHKYSDLFGFIDYIGMKRGCIIGVQSTISDARLEHVRKLIELRPAVLMWLTRGDLWLVSWRRAVIAPRKKSKTGKKAIRWEYRIEAITEEYLAAFESLNLVDSN